MKTHVVMKIFHQRLTEEERRKKEERLIVARQFSEFWSKNFIKENVVTTSSGTATKNQYYCPDFVTKLKPFYLLIVPLWTKLMEEKIKNKNEQFIPKPTLTRKSRNVSKSKSIPQTLTKTLT